MTRQLLERRRRTRRRFLLHRRQQHVITHSADTTRLAGHERLEQLHALELLLDALLSHERGRLDTCRRLRGRNGSRRLGLRLTCERADDEATERGVLSEAVLVKPFNQAAPPRHQVDRRLIAPLDLGLVERELQLAQIDRAQIKRS